MNVSVMKTPLLLIPMIAIILMDFITKDDINSNLFTSHRLIFHFLMTSQ